MAVPLDPEAVRLAPGLRFATGDGGPLIAMSESALPDWLGAHDAAGNVLDFDAGSDYARACDETFALIDVGSTRALTIDSSDSGAFLARPDGALIIRWVGAHDTETLISAALAIPADRYQDIEGELPHDRGRLVMFDALERGSALDAESMVSIELPAGCYAVRVCAYWEGPVIGVDGLPHDTMVQTIELRRR
ncbi:MAG: hypothetical protein H0T46_30460 [Deltaproteobacteria bacterium]|nr:hypothetical protein [Deltaproteobacteria bacterium]